MRISAKSLSYTAILIFYFIVSAVGLLTSEPMIGDEITHFYMMDYQADELPEPVFRSRIPCEASSEGFEIRRYPHTNLWHYSMAVIYRFTGRQSWVIQVLHALFMVQLLAGVMEWPQGNNTTRNVDNALPTRNDGKRHNSHFAGLVRILMVGSVPMILLFSVAFYQDVPATAQAIWGLRMLATGNFLLSGLFLALALLFKENMILMLPAFMLVIAWRYRKRWKHGVLGIIVVTTMVIAAGGLSASALHQRGFEYYPLRSLEVLKNSCIHSIRSISSEMLQSSTATERGKNNAQADDTESPSPPRSLYNKEIIANHPGDLRLPKNWLIYGGALLPLAILVLLWQGARACRSRLLRKYFPSELLIPALVYALLTYWFLRTAPDIRFFMPSLVIVFIIAGGVVSKLPRKKIWVPLLAVLCLLQSFAVAGKIYQLRHISRHIKEAVDFLDRNPPHPKRIFMYPEGNYRIFPAQHTWYLNYKLRELWRGDNDYRLELLRQHSVGAVVVKKHLIGVLDEEMHNLGIYPRFFVKDLQNDPRFELVFENEAVLIFAVPSASNK